MSDLEFWEERYADPDYIFGTAPNVFLAAQAHRLKPGMSVLAVADGEGRNGVWLAEQGLEVTSIDFSPRALAKARALADQRRVALRVEEADVGNYDWPDAKYDVVVAIFIQFADPPTRARIFSGMKRALKPGGLLLLQGYRPEQLRYGTGGPPQVEHLYTRALLEQSFADMKILELREHDSEIREGARHHGMSALIDLVAVK